jgi:alanine racemase
MTVGSNAWIELDLDTLDRNLCALRAVVRPETAIVFVVKADAYGHGILPVARRAWSQGVRWFAVAHAADAVPLRDLLPEARILLTSATPPAEAAACAAHRLDALVVDIAQAEAMSRAVGLSPRPLSVHVKVDTGMGRLGLPWERAAEEVGRIAGLPGLKLEGLCTHFASSDNADRAFLEAQCARFHRVVELCERSGLRIPMRHASNSGGILNAPEMDLNAVRPGILVYGYAPRGAKREVSMQPFLSWKTRVLQVKRVPAGFPVSYDSTCVTDRPTCLATLDAGYADGYNRRLSNRGMVLLDGRRCRVAGRVTMNLTVVDAGPDTQAQAGDEAVLIGRQGGASVWADELAALCDTIPYEILTSIRSAPRA